MVAVKIHYIRNWNDLSQKPKCSQEQSVLLLGCEKIEATDNTASKPNALSASEEKNTTVRIPASIAGPIIHLGPSLDRLVAGPNATDSWAARITKLRPRSGSGS